MRELEFNTHPEVHRALILSLGEIKAGSRNLIDPYRDGRKPTYIYAFDSSLVFSAYNISRSKWVNDVRKALQKANLPFKEVKTKEAQYVSNWFVLEKHDCALCVCSLRRGGKGIVMSSMEAFHADTKIAKKWMTENEKKRALIESAKKKLTKAERQALGLF